MKASGSVAAKSSRRLDVLQGVQIQVADRGHLRHLPTLRAALKRELKIDTIPLEKEAA